MFIFPSFHHQNIQDLVILFNLFDSLVPGYHVDIMDGKFVPHTMGSLALTHAIRNATTEQLWVHLMVHNPLQYLEQLQLNQSDVVSAHYEALSDNSDNCDLFINACAQKKLIPSLAINPEIPIKTILPLLKSFHHVVIMSVNPGASGQTFLVNTFEKIKELNTWRKTHNPSLSITVDGGVNTNNIAKLKQSGIDAVAITSALFETSNTVDNFNKLKTLT
jgi:ribulose-phosphate 3-epimerase